MNEYENTIQKLIGKSYMGTVTNGMLCIKNV